MKVPCGVECKEICPESFNKVPEVTLAFWIIKNCSYNETSGDTVLLQWAGGHPVEPEMAQK